MGFVREALSNAVSFVREEVMPLRQELVKAGMLSPIERGGFEPKSNLSDPFTYNYMGYGYKERFSFLDYGKARQISYSDAIISAIINTRMNQLAAFSIPQSNKYKIGFKIQMRDKEKSPGRAVKKEAAEIEKFILNCGYPEGFEDTIERRKRDSFETFLRKISRDSLTFDQINFEVVPRKNGLPAEFIAVDAATIRLTADKRDILDTSYGSQTKVDDLNIADYMARSPVATDHKAKHPRLCQVIRGQIVTVYDEWEMAFGVRNPRTDILANGYGFSEIEQLVSVITAHMNAETYNRRFFSQGSAVKGVLAFEGQVPPDQLEAFRRQWHQQVSGVNNAWRTPILSLSKDTKLNWVSLHSSNREMEWGKYMEYLIKSICGVFQIDPIEIGFDISKNPSGAGGGLGLGGGFAMERIQFSQDKGLLPLIRHIQGLINEYIVYRLNPDFEFTFVGYDQAGEKEDIEIEQKQGQVYKTINEIRAEHDLPELPEAEDLKSLGDIIMSPTFIQALSTVGQSQDQNQGAFGQPGDQSGGQPGMPGQDDQSGDNSYSDQDYENMSSEDLQKELDRLQGGGKPGKPGKPDNGSEKSKALEAPMEKSLEILL